MATFKAIISDYKRTDGKYQIRIRVIHNQRTAYLQTPYKISPANFNAKREIINLDLKKALKSRIDELYERIATISDIDTISVKELIKRIEKPKQSADIDLFTYWYEKIEGFKIAKAKQTVDGYRTAVDRLKAFYETELQPDDFTVRLLNDFEINLRTVPGKQNKIASNTTIRLYTTYLSTLAEIAETEDVITRNPFRKGYKKPKANTPDKRSLDVEILRKIINDKPELPLEVQAHDVFVLSFCLAGMNTADMFHASACKGKRIEYHRKKTKSRNKQQSFISIMPPAEIKDLLIRYSDPKFLFNFHTLYNSSGQFNKRVNEGLENICTRLKIPAITTYYARHSFASIARNECFILVDDIDLCLIHASSHTMTDIYTKVDYTRVDRAIRAVLDLVYKTKGGMKVVKTLKQNVS
ncbi:MAG: phage integrase SAM-like domain-containing protein [Bacteroidota bacterium]